MWIDITKFMIISIEQFNDIITHYNVSLTPLDSNYLSTYIIANIFAYFVILIMVYTLFRFVHKLMPRDWRKYRL